MLKKIFMLGADGVIGTVLCQGLIHHYSIVPLDKALVDLRIFHNVIKKIPAKTDVIVHLAWDPKPIYKNGTFHDDNFVMTHNVLEAAVQKKIRRVILASSVHANEYRSLSHSGKSSGNRTHPESMDSGVSRLNKVGIPRMTTGADWPTSIYGATKLYFEALGRYYARYHNLEVVVIRFGGVNRENSPKAVDEIDYEKIFLSHEDLITSVQSAIEKKRLKHNYWSFYAKSYPKNS